MLRGGQSEHCIRAMGLTEEDIKLNCEDAGTEAVDESNSADGTAGIMTGHLGAVYEWGEGGGISEPKGGGW